MSTILTPDSEKEYADVVRQAAADNTGIRILGGGSKEKLGQKVQSMITASTEKLDGVTHYDPGALSLVVKAGTTMNDIEEVLDKEGQRLAFEPTDYRGLFRTHDKNPTIGGIVACGISGPRRIRVGACRDSLLGVRFVNGRGEIIKNGGRVMKNVTGYDLVKFLCGSYGTLGVMTELSFKTAPKPETEATFIVSGFDDRQAIRFMSLALGQPLDISGAVHAPGETPETYLRIEGLRSSVKHKLQRLEKLLVDFSGMPNFGSNVIRSTESENLWQKIRDIDCYTETSGAVWKISLRPIDTPPFMELLKENMDVEAFYDWGGGLIWLHTPTINSETAGLVRMILDRFGGHATLVKANDALKEYTGVFHPEPKPLALLAKKIRAEFDPCHILNPGLMTVGGAE